MAKNKQVRPDQLDPEAVEAAAAAVEKALNGPRFLLATELAAIAINAYLEDVIRQLNLQPCEDCEEDQDGSDDANPDRTSDANPDRDKNVDT